MASSTNCSTGPAVVVLDGPVAEVSERSARADESTPARSPTRLAAVMDGRDTEAIVSDGISIDGRDTEGRANDGMSIDGWDTEESVNDGTLIDTADSTSLVRVPRFGVSRDGGTINGRDVVGTFPTMPDSIPSIGSPIELMLISGKTGSEIVGTPPRLSSEASSVIIPLSGLFDVCTRETVFRSEGSTTEGGTVSTRLDKTPPRTSPGRGSPAVGASVGISLAPETLWIPET